MTNITREDVVRNISSEHLIVFPDGREMQFDKNPASLKDIGNRSLEQYILSEEIGSQAKAAPPSINAMQRLELVGYEPSSDVGNFRFYPKGNFMLKLLEDWASEIATERFGAQQVLTPILYRSDDAQIKKQIESFHERHYTIDAPDGDTSFALRFAADPGEFKMIESAQISYRSLPLRLYEFSRSFRYEKHGELAGLRRLRSFHMPDVHSFVKDIDAGWKEYQELFRQYTDLANGTGIEYAVVFRSVKDFYVNNKEIFQNMLRYCEKPAFIELLSGMKHYWAVKHEFQAIDSVGGNTQLSTVQLDVQTNSNFNLTYTDSDGEKKPLYICHSSIGSLERWMYSILEDALKKKDPTLPLWISPTQVRIIPVADRNLEDAMSLGNSFQNNRVRVDYDDRDGSVGKKIRDSAKEWVPYTIVFGDKEKDSGRISVRDRYTGKTDDYDVQSFIAKLGSETQDKPFRKLPVDRFVSRRVKYS